MFWGENWLLLPPRVVGGCNIQGQFTHKGRALENGHDAVFSLHLLKNLRAPPGQITLSPVALPIAAHQILLKLCLQGVRRMVRPFCPQGIGLQRYATPVHGGST